MLEEATVTIVNIAAANGNLREIFMKNALNLVFVEHLYQKSEAGIMPPKNDLQIQLNARIYNYKLIPNTKY